MYEFDCEVIWWGLPLLFRLWLHGRWYYPLKTFTYGCTQHETGWDSGKLTRHFTKDVEGYRICLLITGYGEAATQDKLIRACH